MRKTIDYETVVAATEGELLAVGEVMDYFSDTIDTLCTGFYVDASGQWKHGIDPEMKSHMQSRLLQAMLKFDP